MNLHFDWEKSLQAVGVLLEADEGRMGYMRLLKLLYISDRELLAATGRTITGDHALAMKNGPVLSRVYDTIQGMTPHSDVWFRFIHHEGYKVTLKEPPGRGKLSKREIGKLQEVSDRYRHLEDFDLSEETHGFEEWQKNYQAGAPKPIPWEDALIAQNKADMIPVAEQEAAARTALDAVFGG